jgi:hypothetical protein
MRGAHQPAEPGEPTHASLHFSVFSIFFVSDREVEHKVTNNGNLRKVSELPAVHLW